MIVTPACAADTETEVLVACGTTERGLLPLVGHVSVDDGQVFLQVLVVLGATNHAEVVTGGGRGAFGVVLSHALQTKEVRLLGPGFAAVDCCEVVADELQAEFIYEHVEGAKAVAGTGVGSVGIHRPVHHQLQNSVVLAMFFSNFMELSVIYISFSVIFVNFQ